MKTISLLLLAVFAFPSLTFAGRIYGSIRIGKGPIAKGTKVEITAVPRDTILVSAGDTTLVSVGDTTLTSATTSRSGSYHLYVKDKGWYILKVHYPKGRDPKKAHIPSIEVYSHEKSSSRYDLILYQDKHHKYHLKRR